MPDSNYAAGARKCDPLTEREREILALLSTGNAPPDIAAQLGLALGTVKNYILKIYTKIGAKPERNPLTDRELEILALLAAGNSSPDIAEQLGISSGTVKTHLTSVYKKIGAKNRVQAARYYLDHLARPRRPSDARPAPRTFGERSTGRRHRLALSCAKWGAARRSGPHPHGGRGPTNRSLPTDMGYWSIAGQLGITPGTVKNHLTSVYRKVGAKNRIQATRHYLDHYTIHRGAPLPRSAATDRPRRAGERSPLIQRQIQEIEARLEQLASATSEAERLHEALEALRAIEPH